MFGPTLVLRGAEGVIAVVPGSPGWPGRLAGTCVAGPSDGLGVERCDPDDVVDGASHQEPRGTTRTGSGPARTPIELLT